MYRVLELLRNYVLGDNPIELQLLTDGEWGRDFDWSASQRMGGQ